MTEHEFRNAVAQLEERVFALTKAKSRRSAESSDVSSGMAASVESAPSATGGGDTRSLQQRHGDEEEIATMCDIARALCPSGDESSDG